MSISFRAILACLSFYSGLYLIYFFFITQQNALFIILGVAGIVLSWFLTPYPHERGRQDFNDTMMFGTFFYNPLIFWFRFFSWPIRTLLNIFSPH